MSSMNARGCSAAMAAVALVLGAGCAAPTSPTRAAADRQAPVDSGAPHALAAPDRLAAGFDAECPTPLFGCNFTDTSHGPAAIVSWTWDFGDGGPGLQMTPSSFVNPFFHQYRMYENQHYRVRLTVQDATGATDTVAHVVQVKARQTRGNP